MGSRNLKRKRPSQRKNLTLPRPANGSHGHPDDARLDGVDKVEKPLNNKAQTEGDDAGLDSLPWRKVRMPDEEDRVTTLTQDDSFACVLSLEEIPSGSYSIVDNRVLVCRDSNGGDSESETADLKFENAGKRDDSSLIEGSKLPEKVDFKDIDYDLEGMSAWGEFGLHDGVVDGLAKLNFHEPTRIQSLCIPRIVGGADVVGLAETGSGKTLAFGLPMLSFLMNELEGDRENKLGLCGLVLTPTRELAMQIVRHLEAVISSINKQKKLIRIGALLGGMSLAKQERLLSQEPPIVVATPGRLWALVCSRHAHLNEMQRKLRFLVIDEADRMFDSGHFPDLKPLIALFQKGKESGLLVKRQTLMFSATLFLIERKTSSKRDRNGKKKLADSKHVLMEIHESISCRGKPVICDATNLKNSSKKDDTENKEIQVPNKVSSSTNEKQNIAKLPKALALCSVHCIDKAKDEYLYYFLTQYTGRTLVFVNTISSLRRIQGMLSFLGILNVATLHAKMQQRQRLRHLEQFAAKDVSVLVATDVAARGLDIKNVDHVIQYGIPSAAATFVHRAGRTARGLKNGICCALVGPSEAESFERIKTVVSPKTFEDFAVSSTYIVEIKERVALARRLEILNRRQNSAKAESNWFVKNAKEADLVLDESVFAGLDDYSGVKRSKRHRSDCDPDEKEFRSLKARLDSYLSRPIVPNHTSTRYLNTSVNDVHTRLVQGKARDMYDEVQKLSSMPKSKKRAMILR